MRNPASGHTPDEELLGLYRRANLDAFWARATNTVHNNLKEGQQVEGFATRYGFPSGISPPTGPFPLEDVHGMGPASFVLFRSLSKGRYEEFVQWDTFRRARSAISNIAQSGPEGLSDAIAAYQKNCLWITGSPTYSFWFCRFMDGVHKRVGEHIRRDEPITIKVLKHIDMFLSEDWAQCRDLDVRKVVAEMGVWFVAGFCTGLRGEEMLLIEFAGTRRASKGLRDPLDPYFAFVIAGKTKANQLEGNKFSIPCVAVTQGSNLEPGKWVRRLLRIRKKMGLTKGRLFERTLSTPKLFEFEYHFYQQIERVQALTNCIAADVDVRDAYGIKRSLRRGITAHGINMGMSKQEMELHNRWRGEYAASSGGAPRADMVHVYAPLKSLLPAFKRLTRKF